MGEKKFTHVPVYLPDRTEIGTAKVDVEQGTAVISIQSDSNLAELLSEQLVAFSVVYMGDERIESNQGEETDGS